MPIRTALWKVTAQPTQLPEAVLPSEKLLEDMIVAQPFLLSDAWMLIGRQERTGQGGIIDLLAIAPDGSLVLIELKRDRTPRDVVAQALDYASWVEELQAEEISAIYRRFKSGQSLSDDFKLRFGQALDEDTLNQAHQIVIVAAQLDDSTERIVAYLNKRDIAINVLCFQVFAHGSDQLLSRAWLLDPVQTQANVTPPADSGSEPWNGEFYVSFGHGIRRSWTEAMKYGFICGGGGAWYSRTLQLLKPGDRVWVNVPNTGYVGVGRVTSHAVRGADFKIVEINGDAPMLDVLTEASYHREFLGDPERSEWFVAVDWLQVVPLDQAVKEIGFFGNQNTVCKPTTPKWRITVDRLKERFGISLN
ncbi:MAG: endonuclease NucS domain-containing protein [Polaromonas sp.]